jgi:hypothetical protein
MAVTQVRTQHFRDSIAQERALDKLITTKKWSEYVVSYVSDAEYDDQLIQQP